MPRGLWGLLLWVIDSSTLWARGRPSMDSTPLGIFYMPSILVPSSPSIIIPMASNTEATTRSITRKGM